jgi:hypothetical protein
MRSQKTAKFEALTIIHGTSLQLDWGLDDHPQLDLKKLQILIFDNFLTDYFSMRTDDKP